MKDVRYVQEKLKKVKDRGNQVVKKVKIIDEFKAFISRGNVLDLAVGVIIGASFQSLVTSLTDNIISPILGCFSEVDFSDYVLNIGNLSLRYGSFFTDVINFVIMAFVVFLIVKVMNRLLIKHQEETKEEIVEGEEVVLLKEIRDLLKEEKN